MTIRFENDKTPERDKLIKKVLPTETIIGSILEPAIEKRLFDVLAECIKKEIEIYRAYPKDPSISGDDKKETPAEMLETFDPRNNNTCYMGKAFKANREAIDADLRDYRKAIGTIHHPVWGDCTLLEIWGGDHFEDHNEMVVGVFKYGMNLTDTCPEIKVYTNPLFKNKLSKEFKISEEQQAYKDEMEMLLAKAMIFGVNTPEQARRARKR
jgi:hypothetical protein